MAVAWVAQGEESVKGASADPLGMDGGLSQEEFIASLTTLLERTEQSIGIVRSQIVQNQNAPFIAELYLQLGEFLVQKSATLYYIQMEKSEGDSSARNSPPILEAQKEAIEVFQTLIRDFPKFDKKAKAYYLLAVSYRAIGDGEGFLKTCSSLTSEFPKSQEAMRARLQLGEHYYEKQEHKKALDILMPVIEATFVLERNQARYRAGMIYLALENPKAALASFENIVRDNDLKEEEVPLELSLKRKQMKTNLKREALIDSIRPYTAVNTKDPDPVGYYSRLAPNEIMFQEVIEKLAFRYISLKRYEESIRLIRALSVRTVEPQKVVQMFRDILSSVPLQERVRIPPEEIRFLLERLNEWLTLYRLPKEIYNKSIVFFEMQLRDLGTRLHDLAKKEKDSKLKANYLDRAGKYYLMYLAFFRGSKYSAKIATNLGDVYHSQARYVESADWYLRAFLGEFGKPPETRPLIESAIASAQKEGDYSFYEQLRIRGVLLKALSAYMSHFPDMKKDARINFLYHRTRYEQGRYDEAIPSLFAFMKRFRSSKYAADAGDLILDYFNTRKDYVAMSEWTAKILSLRLPDSAFVRKVTLLKQKSAGKQLEETVKSQGGFDAFQQGKSYLNTALNLEDESLRNTALQQALAKSKSENDLETFFKAAATMAEMEGEAGKKAEIQQSAAIENSRIGRYYAALAELQKIYGGKGLPGSTRIRAFERAVDLVLLMRDWKTLVGLSEGPLWGQIGSAAKTKARQLLSEVVESPLADVDDAARLLLSMPDEGALLSCFKGKKKLASELQDRIGSQVTSLCSAGKNSSVCRWSRLAQLDRVRADYLASLDRGLASETVIQEKAKQFASVSEMYRGLENSGDPELEILVSLRGHEIYRGLAEYLRTTAERMPNLKKVLLQKADESLKSASQYLDRCRSVMKQSRVISPLTLYCQKAQHPSLEEGMSRDTFKRSAPSQDETSSEVLALQKKIFGGSKDPSLQLELSEAYFIQGFYHHAAALASDGEARYRDQGGDFKAILGCSLVQLGLLSEANYHLLAASSHRGLKEKCLRQLETGESQS